MPQLPIIIIELTKVPDIAHPATKTVVSKTSSIEKWPTTQRLNQIQSRTIRGLSGGENQEKANGSSSTLHFHPLLTCVKDPSSIMDWGVANVAMNLLLLIVAACEIWFHDEADRLVLWSVSSQLYQIIHNC
jgi:hypothetical protein